MREMTLWRRLIPVAASTAFSVAVIAGGEVLRYSQYLLAYRTPNLDLFLTYAVLSLALFLALVPVTFLVVAAAHSSASRGTRFARFLQALPDGWAFVLVWTAFLQTLRFLAYSFLTTARSIPPDWWLFGGIGFAILIYSLRTGPVREWLHETYGLLTIAGALFGMISLGLVSWGYVAAVRERVVASPQTTGASRPDVYLLVLDSLTTKVMSVYGSDLPTTPNLNSLAKEWTVYENAHSPSTTTLLSTASILTGRHPYFNQYTVYGDLVRMQEDWVSLPNLLREEGYETAGVHFAYPPNMLHMQPYFDRVHHPVLDFTPARWVAWVSRHMPTRVDMVLGLALNEYRGTSSLLPGSSTSRDEEWTWANHVVRNKGKRPLFLYLHADRPHYPYTGETTGTFLPLSEGLTIAKQQSPFLDKTYTSDQQDLIDHLWLRYAETVTIADRRVGEFIQGLKDRGLYNDAMIIVTSDHGENFTKGNQGHSTYLMGVAEHHVPLLVKYPRQQEGQRISELVQTLDILPTVMDVLGTGISDTVEGVSLLHPDRERVGYTVLLNASQSGRDYGVVVTKGHLKLQNHHGAITMFDLEQDYAEKENLVSTSSAVATELYRLSEAYIRRTDHLRQGGSVREAPVLMINYDTRLGEPSTLSITPGNKLAWWNTDASLNEPWKDERLAFWGEPRRSYTVLPASGTDLMLIEFRAAKDVSITAYVEAKDQHGNRLDFRSTLADSRLATDGDWTLMAPLPAGTVNVVLTFRHAYNDDITWIEDIRITQFKTSSLRRVVSAAGEELSWLNVAGEMSPPFAAPRLRFGDESQRSYAEFKLEPETTHLHLEFETDSQFELINYVDVARADGSRLDFLIISSPAQANPKRVLLIGLPTGGRTAKVFFKMAQEDKIGYVERIRIDQLTDR